MLYSILFYGVLCTRTCIRDIIRDNHTLSSKGWRYDDPSQQVGMIGEPSFKVIRFDLLAPVQKLVQRYTLQMKMFFSVNYIMNLNCGRQKFAFSLPEV